MAFFQRNFGDLRNPMLSFPDHPGNCAQHGPVCRVRSIPTRKSAERLPPGLLRASPFALDHPGNLQLSHSQSSASIYRTRVLRTRRVKTGPPL